MSKEIFKSKIYKDEKGRTIQSINVNFTFCLGNDKYFIEEPLREEEFYPYILSCINSQLIVEHLLEATIPDKFTEQELKLINNIWYRMNFISDSYQMHNVKDWYLDLQHKLAEEISDKIREIKGQCESGYVYLMKNMRNGYVKIGFSKKPEYRERTLQSQEPEVELIWKIPGGYDHEMMLHAKYHNKRIRGEWFDLSDKDIAEIVK